MVFSRALVTIFFSSSLFLGCSHQPKSQETERQPSSVSQNFRLRWVPFFLESAPPRIDPRKGLEGLPPAPISAEELKKIFHESLAPLMFDLSGSRFSGNLSMHEIILMTATKIQDSLVSTLERVDANLGNQQGEYSLVLLPWDETGSNYSRQGIQVFDRVGGRSSFGQPERFYGRIESNFTQVQYLEYQRRDSSPLPIYFLGVLMNIHLKKNQSHIRTQILLGLLPQEKAFSQANEQIVFTHFGVPAVSPVSGYPLLSAELTHYVRTAKRRPSLTLEFGPQQGWNKQIGQLKLRLGDSRRTCEGQDTSSPYLRGRLGPKSMGQEWLARRLEGFPVNFGISRVDVDLQSLQISNMDLALGADFRMGSARMIMGCFNSAGIDDQFRDEVNKTLQSQIQAQRQSALDFLQSLLGDQRRGAIR